MFETILTTTSMATKPVSNVGETPPAHPQRAGRPKVWFLLLVVVFVVFVVSVSGLITWSSYPLKFDPETWKNQPRLRSRMVEDLLAQEIIEGATRQRVNELLGTPTGRDSATRGSYIYWIGNAGIDDNWLEIEFENDATVLIRRYPD